MSLTNDNLLAISQLLDVKLKAEIQPIKNEIHTLGNEVQNVRGSLGCLQNEVQDLRGSLSYLQDEMQDVRGSLNCLQKEMQLEMQVVHSSLNNLHTQIHQMKLFQENKIMPRLNTIESCNRTKTVILFSSPFTAAVRVTHLI